MKTKYIEHIRTYHPYHTEGEIFLPDRDTRYCWALEDIPRPYGMKFPGETCIPEGVYNLTATMSRRFKKKMLMLSNQDNGYEIIKNGVNFKGIRCHGGNTIENSLGCVLLNYNN